MKKSRRQFIKNSSMITAIMATGGFQGLAGSELYNLRKKVRLRFIIASDAHYGQPDTPYDQLTEAFTSKANAFHQKQVCDFCVLNGDIIHDEAHLMQLAKNKFDHLSMPYYVTKGNHDKITDSKWQTIWNIPVNHRIVKAGNAFIFATTSDETGAYLSPKLGWMEEALTKSRKQNNTFVFIHIPQAKWTANAIDTPAFFELLSNYNNIKAVFHGHEHDQDGIKMHRGIPFIFDSHIGGSWGTDYKGFRVVEILKDNTIITYMMNPETALEKNTL